MELPFRIPSPLDPCNLNSVLSKGIVLRIKRDDLIHPLVSGNKWRKLQHNIAKAMDQGHDTVLTLGGAYSNHILATAATCELFGLKSIGVIRGEDADLHNATLKEAAAHGMHMHLISRGSYRNASSWEFVEALKSLFGKFYFIPEGGANILGVLGCMDIMKELKEFAPHRIFVACGTATTLSGLCLANTWGAQLYGVSALKGGAFLKEQVCKRLHELLGDAETEQDMGAYVHILDQFHFGGYARVNSTLLDYMRRFQQDTGIKLDPVYTAKCAYAMEQMALGSTPFVDERWVLIHSGGLQGIAGIEERLDKSIF